MGLRQAKGSGVGTRAWVLPPTRRSSKIERYLPDSQAIGIDLNPA